VRKTSSWPRSTKYLVGPISALSSCIPAGMHGPTCIFWADLTPLLALADQERGGEPVRHLPRPGHGAALLRGRLRRGAPRRGTTHPRTVTLCEGRARDAPLTLTAPHGTSVLTLTLPQSSDASPHLSCFMSVMLLEFPESPPHPPAVHD
jgi:hypothetical protein